MSLKFGSSAPAILKNQAGLTKQIEEILLDQIGPKLPKKWRKKMRWQQVVPIVSFLLTVMVQLVGVFFKADSRPTSTAKPTGQRNLPGSERSAAQATLSNPALEAQLRQALAYQVEIEQLLRASATPQRQQELVGLVNEWLNGIKELVQRVDNFRQNELIRQDLRAVPQSIAQLEARLAGTEDETIRAGLENTLKHRRQQLLTLQQLERTMHWAEIKIESTVSLLGTLYSQLLTGQSTNQVADYRHLLAEAEDEVQTLQDYLAALAEVKLGSATQVQS